MNVLSIEWPRNESSDWISNLPVALRISDFVDPYIEENYLEYLMGDVEEVVWSDIGIVDHVLESLRTVP